MKAQRSERACSSLCSVGQEFISTYTNDQTSPCLLSHGFLSLSVGQGCVCAVLMTPRLIDDSCIVVGGNSYVNIHSFHRAEECACLQSDLRARREDRLTTLSHSRSCRKQTPSQSWGMRDFGRG